MGTRRVVVIDDNETVRWLVRYHLEHAGCDVIEVSDDFAATMQHPTWTGVDVAVVDLLLGGDVSGSTILSWLASHEPQVRRVMFTARLDDYDVTSETAALGVLVPKGTPLRRLVEAVLG